MFRLIINHYIECAITRCCNNGESNAAGNDWRSAAGKSNSLSAGSTEAAASAKLNSICCGSGSRPGTHPGYIYLKHYFIGAGESNAGSVRAFNNRAGANTAGCE